ncbi:hypothetical protein ACFL0H_10375 [Thermodesulfobacteriota bacterium]
MTNKQRYAKSEKRMGNLKQEPASARGSEEGPREVEKQLLDLVVWAGAAKKVMSGVKGDSTID